MYNIKIVKHEIKFFFSWVLIELIIISSQIPQQHGPLQTYFAIFPYHHRHKIQLAHTLMEGCFYERGFFNESSTSRTSESLL